jgi:hypothetical protein
VTSRARVPLVLLDVDGVLNAVTAYGDPAVWSDWRYGAASADGRRWPITWSPTVAASVRRWQETGLADVRWLTTWREHANAELRRLLDLPELSVVGEERAPLVDAVPEPGAGSHAEFAGADAASLLTGRWWKFDLVVDLVRAEPARPLVWLDDDLRTKAPVLEWLQVHATCLPVAPRAATGLTPDQLARVEEWLTAHQPDRADDGS